MAQEYGAAQPIADFFKKPYDKLTKYLGDPSEPVHTGKEDTSWHDEMVKRANESFAKKAEEDKKAAAKKAPQKRMPRKR